MQLSVVYEDNHLLALNKPPGLPTMGAGPGTPTLLEHARRYLAEKYDKPGNVYLGVVSRLDAPVTGLLMMARTSKAAGRLSIAFRDRSVNKFYLAAVEGQPPEPSATLVHHLRKDDRNRRMHTTTPAADGAQRAELSYQLIASGKRGGVLLVRLGTGRKHQIRVQLAKIGCPILGDRKYGATPLDRFEGIGLHSWRLRFEHPVRREPRMLSVPPPESWRRLGVETGEAEALASEAVGDADGA